jgi:hypothetical protein
LDGRGGQVLIVATPGDESNRGRLGGSPGRRMRDARRQVVFWKVDGSCRFPRSVRPPGPGDRTPGPARGGGTGRSAGHTGDELRGCCGARREFGCCRGFFFFLLSPIPLAVAEKRNTSGCLHAYLELCGGGAWPRRRGGGIGDRPSGSGSSRRRIGRRRPLRHVRLYVSARATVRACDHSPAGGPVDRSSCIACDAIDFIFPPRIYICLAVASTLLPLGLWAGDGLDRAARTSEHAATGVARVVVMAFPLRWLPACLRCRGQKENACGTAILSYFLTHVN